MRTSNSTGSLREGPIDGERGLGVVLDLHLITGAAHRVPGVEHDGVPDDFAYQPAMPYVMPTTGPQTDPSLRLG